MAWDRNDWIAAALIIALLVMAVIVAAMLLGWMPSVDKFFKFQGELSSAVWILPNLQSIAGDLGNINKGELSSAVWILPN